LATRAVESVGQASGKAVSIATFEQLAGEAIAGHGQELDQVG
jgi:hypothetical protein